MGGHAAVVLGLVAMGRRRHVVVPGPLDIAVAGLATQKLSRLVAKQVVTTPIRAPFTEVVGSGGPAEIHERPVGAGWRRTVGELVNCPFCLDVWFATGVISSIAFAPRAGRTLAAGLAAVGVADFLQLAYARAQALAEAVPEAEPRLDRGDGCRGDGPGARSPA